MQRCIFLEILVSMGTIESTVYHLNANPNPERYLLQNKKLVKKLADNSFKSGNLQINCIHKLRVSSFRFTLIQQDFIQKSKCS